MGEGPLGKLGCGPALCGPALCGERAGGGIIGAGVSGVETGGPGAMIPGPVAGTAGAPAPHVIVVLTRPSSNRGIATGATTGGRIIVTPTLVTPPPASAGLTSTLARPAASVGTSTEFPPS